MTAIKLLVMPRFGVLGGSSRLRFSQYLPYLCEHGFHATEAPLLDDACLQAQPAGADARPRYSRLLRSYARRARRLRSCSRFDLVWAEQEFLPWLPAAIELGLLAPEVPVVLDCDDAIFHRYDGHSSGLVRRLLGDKIDAMMRRADLALAGNAYLATRARDAGCRRVEQLPTVVDMLHYPPRDHRVRNVMPIIGWIGSPDSARYLRQLTPTLLRLQSRHAFRCVAIGAHPEQLEGTPFEAQPWSEASEAADLRGFDVGVMPLADTPWEQGKCGYRLIQCMASGLPVVAAPVGVNRDIVIDGVHGFLPGTSIEWDSALDSLLRDPGMRGRMGAAGRLRIENKYSLQAQAPRLLEMLRSVALRPSAG